MNKQKWVREKNMKYTNKTYSDQIQPGNSYLLTIPQIPFCGFLYLVAFYLWGGNTMKRIAIAMMLFALLVSYWRANDTWDVWGSDGSHVQITGGGGTGPMVNIGR